MASSDKPVAIVWGPGKQDIYTDMTLALKKAAETGSSIRVFNIRSKALEFAKTLRKKPTPSPTDVAIVSPTTAARAPPASKKVKDNSSESNAGGEVDADMLKQMLRKRMLNRSGNKIVVYWKELTGKDIIIVVVDVCRETTAPEGEGTTRHVSALLSVQTPLMSMYHLLSRATSIHCITITAHKAQGLTLPKLFHTTPCQQNFHQHSPVFVSETAGMHGAGGLVALPIQGKPIDVYLRKTPYDEDNEYRGRTNKQGTWNDKAIMFRLPTNTQLMGGADEQVQQFYNVFKKFILSKGVRSLLVDAMYNGMSSHKLVKKLEKDDAEYWKLWKQVEPSFQNMESLDEIVSNEGIQMVVQTTLKDELSGPSSDLDDDLLRDLFNSESLPLDVENMFRGE